MERKTGGLQYRVSPVEVRKVDGNPRALTFVASTADVARDGDIIEVEGWQVANYLRNPVFLWSHNPDALPVGRGIAVRVNDSLDIDVEFDIDEHSDDILGKYERGFLRAVSVGFRPLAYRKPDDDERAELGLPQYGVIWTKAELYEVSAVSVPADPGALIKQSAYRSLDDRLARDTWLAEAVDETPETRAAPSDPDPVSLTDKASDDARAAEPDEDALVPASPPARHAVDLSAVDGAHLGAILEMRKALR